MLSWEKQINRAAMEVYRRGMNWIQRLGLIKTISVLENTFFFSIACNFMPNAGYVCIPCITKKFFSSCFILSLLSSCLENLCIGQKFQRIVSHSMLSSCWGASFYRLLLTNRAEHNCAVFLCIPYVSPKEHQSTYLIRGLKFSPIVVGPTQNSGKSSVES